MKIYNEIITKFNEKTQRWETVYEDSFNYSNNIMQLQTGDNTPQSTDDPEYAQLWHNENIEEYKQVVATKITKLLLEKFSQIKEITGENYEQLQKTFRNGLLSNGRYDNDVMVVYENDTDADNDKKNDILKTILNWAGFINPNQFSITISSPVNIEGEQFPVPTLQLNANGKSPLVINNIVGELNLQDVKLRETVSQFFHIDKVKTSIDRSKLQEYIETEFSELNPITFTHILERYQKFKSELPFFSYRTDDFFDEYSSTTVPNDYRLSRFFEEFERLKSEIPAGRFGYEAVTIRAEGTNGYLNKDDGQPVPRKLIIIERDGTEKLVYEDPSERGLRITVFSKDSFSSGKWNGAIKYDEVFDTYGGNETQHCLRMETCNRMGGSACGPNDNWWSYSETIHDCSTIFGEAGLAHGGNFDRKAVCDDGSTHVLFTGPWSDRQWPQGGEHSGDSICGDITDEVGISQGYLHASQLASLIADDSQIAQDDLIVITSFDAVRFVNDDLTDTLKSIGAYDPRLMAPEVVVEQDEPFREQRTGYTLIGSKQFNRGQGVEVITEASSNSDPAVATKFWPPDADYIDWQENTTGYIISELQQYTDEEIPVYTSGEVMQMNSEMESLITKNNDLSLIVQNKDTYIETLESQLESLNTVSVYHGDCAEVIVYPGNIDFIYSCNDTTNIQYEDGDSGSVVVTCTDGTKLPVWCGIHGDDPSGYTGMCEGQPAYPQGGPVTGQQACEGS
jgi:hypothetical protein